MADDRMFWGWPVQVPAEAPPWMPGPVPAEAPPAPADQTGGPPSREQMQAQMARQFGFDSWEEFRTAAERRLGKTVVRRLEKELERYPPAGGGPGGRGAGSAGAPGGTPPQAGR